MPDFNSFLFELLVLHFIFRYAWGTSDKKWVILNTLPLGQSKQGKA